MFARTIEFAAQRSKFFTRGNVSVLQDIHLVSKRVCRSHYPIYFLFTHAIGLRLQVPQVFASVIEFAAQRPKFFTRSNVLLLHGIDDCRRCPHPRCVRIASAAQIREPAILYLKSACPLLEPLVQFDICSC